MTEEKMWRLLRNRRLADFKFRRQYPIGPFILDFYCFEKKLAVEVDGAKHLESSRQTADAARSRYLADLGITVIRFLNGDVLSDREAVLQAIVDALTRPSGAPSPKGARVRILPSTEFRPRNGR